jgi:hypothetical protein
MNRLNHRSLPSRDTEDAGRPSVGLVQTGNAPPRLAPRSVERARNTDARMRCQGSRGIPPASPSKEPATGGERASVAARGPQMADANSRRRLGRLDREEARPSASQELPSQRDLTILESPDPSGSERPSTPPVARHQTATSIAARAQRARTWRRAQGRAAMSCSRSAASENPQPESQERRTRLSGSPRRTMPCQDAGLAAE